MKFEVTPLQGLWVIRPEMKPDSRGHFVKTFHEGDFRRNGINFRVAEMFYSVSNEGVVRGMHYQRPPAAHAKLVYCAAGEILDVVLDLRPASPTYGQHHTLRLSAEEATMVYVPEGFAHGFLSLRNGTMTVYATTCIHSPGADAGVRWDSFGFDWPVRNPVMSARDAAFPPLPDFVSPF